MPNAFYAPGPRRAARVNDLFGAIARRYDLLNDIQSVGMHRWWKRRLVRQANVRAGDLALDVCCGTGDIACALAALGAEVTGLDFSDAMLEIARARVGRGAADQSKLNPKFVKGDAERIPFPDGAFDIVTVGYGLRNLASWETGLREMIRVARPGARLLVLDFGKPPNPLWSALYFAYLRAAVPALGRVFCGQADAYAYILESLCNYPAQTVVASQMRQFGLANVGLVNFLGGAMCIVHGAK